MDLEIRYENGSMTVHLEEFLNIRSIAKVRKLLKLIRSSFTPECEQQIKEFVQDWIEQFEQKQLETERYITGYEQKVSYCQKQLRMPYLSVTVTKSQHRCISRKGGTDGMKK